MTEHSAFAGFRYPPAVIVLAVRWYLRYGLSYRDLEELLDERGVEVDHVTLFRWVQRFTPLLIDAARPCRHAVGDRWLVDEAYVKVAGRWRYVYRAIDQHGQIIKARLKPMRGLKRDQTASVIIRGHAFMQNIRRGHDELDVDTLSHLRVAAAFSELARTI
ncbi:MAG: IS6 family transposase [Acidimicrobiales bacterium]